MNAVLSAEWSSYYECFEYFVNGTNYSPEITVTDAEGDRRFEVSSAECGVLDHSADSPVISCPAYDGEILDAPEAVIAGAGAPRCSGFRAPKACLMKRTAGLFGERPCALSGFSVSSAKKK